MKELLLIICIIFDLIFCCSVCNNFEEIDNTNMNNPECSVYELYYFSLDTINIDYSKLIQKDINTKVDKNTEVNEDIKVDESIKVDNSKSELSNDKKDYIKKYEDIIVCDGVISDISLYIITERLDSIPSNIMALFRENSWTIRIVDYQLETLDWGTNTTGSFTALTDVSNKTIWIEDTNNALANSTCHEFGHFVDYMSGLTSISDDFNIIYEAERYLFNDSTRESNSYAISTASEYFASVFSEYCINQDWGISDAYQSFNWINNIVKNL